MKQYTVEQYIDREGMEGHYIFDFEVDITIDNEYGADADGNRGGYAVFLNDWTVEILKVVGDEYQEVETSPELYELSQELINEMDMAEVLI